MPRPASSRRSVSPILKPEVPPPVDEPPTADSISSEPIEEGAAVVFRVGKYEVGEVFCPHLCGHPDIRY